jgi:hypothetical protein
MPIPDALGFYGFAIVFSLILVGAYFSLLCQLGLSRQSAAIATILLTMNRYFFGFTVWDYFQIDDLISEVLLVLLFTSMIKNNWWIYSILLVLGAITRETVFIIIPTTLFYLWERKKLEKAFWPFLGSVLPGVALFVALRLILKSTCTNHEVGLPQSGTAYYFWAFLKYLPQFFQPETLFRRIVNVFIPFSFLPIIFLGETIRFAAQYKHMVIYFCLVFASAFFGGDSERLMAPTFIVFYFFLGTMIENKMIGKRSAIAVICAITFISSLHHQNARFMLPSQRYTLLLSMGSLCLMTVLCTWYRFSQRKKSP